MHSWKRISLGSSLPVRDQRRRLRRPTTTALMASGTRRGPASRTRSSGSSIEIVEVHTAPAAAGCVDLTLEADEEFVDLTSVNDSPIVVLDSPAVSQTGTRQRPGRQALETTINLSHDTTSSLSLNSDSDTENVIPVPVLDLCETSSTPGDKQTEDGPSTSGLNDSTLSTPGGKIISCPICLDSDKQIKKNGRKLTSTTCGHIFCNVCISAAVRSQKKCPTCRKKLSLSQIHTIFI